jgi:hypothetical protein
MSTDKWIVTSMSPSPTTGSAFITFTSCT